ncbi:MULTISPECIES: molecular chaperone [Pseudomonas]|uniref:fimbrial biogenesis chaperone n=1 Tax=Pseudomonas TaxID=286 RepID=UPI000B34DFF2|nr:MULTISPECIES: molecular chaperone [Pseudomonas]PMY33062.1 fimbrial chaperone [Pseudomonas sp. GW456-L14]PMY50016.1 fimbrial chaperone [Pseudomonas sp. GW456-L12]PMY64841.1 fimbrial chaperone [Pseudomonas sp. FW305-25]PMY69239.1 fimbrial chaperone [Pseudomonas sp. FW126-L8]PNA80072.1 fimbrial chaperone [Pseudomonas sp. FW305-76]
MKLTTLFSLGRPALVLLLSTSLFSSLSQAGVMLGGTRIVYDGSKRDASITVSNTTGQPYAVQAWVNTETDDNSTPTPFMATPPLFRLDPRKEQIVRIRKVPGALPEDRESVFYFNAQEIPVAGTEHGNTLKVALRTRIKLFYRPPKLQGSSMDALPELRWSLVYKQGKTFLQVNNPSPFHVSFIGVQVVAGQQKIEVLEPKMVAPMKSQSYPLPGFKNNKGEVIFSAINDYGGYSKPLHVPLTSAP